MKRAGRLLRIVFAAVLIAWLATYSWLSLTSVSAKDLPPLQTGDLVFQTSRSSQSAAILLASRSAYSHMGIIELGTDGTPHVVEAVGPVRSTPLNDWIARGLGGRITIKRFTALDPQTAKNILAAAHKYDGLPYDIYFLPDKDHIYCSELVRLAFEEGAQIEIGKMQRLGDLSLDNFAVRNLIKRRWKSDPLCQPSDQETFESCYAKILNQQLVTPVAIADDPRLQLIFSNYGAFVRKP